MTTANNISKDEILKVCGALRTFEKRRPDGAVKSVAARLRGNLQIAADGRERPGFGFVLAEQAETLERLMRQEGGRE